MTTGYEFFLVLRKADASRATIIREWIFQPSDVAKAGLVGARLQYEYTVELAR